MVTSILTLIVMGSMLEGLPSLLIFGPMLLPLAAQYGINQLHFGIVLIIAMGIGTFIPPFGICYFVTCAVLESTVEESTSQVLAVSRHHDCGADIDRGRAVVQLGVTSGVASLYQIARDGLPRLTEASVSPIVDGPAPGLSFVASECSYPIRPIKAAHPIQPMSGDASPRVAVDRLSSALQAVMVRPQAFHRLHRTTRGKRSACPGARQTGKILTYLGPWPAPAHRATA